MREPYLFVGGPLHGQVLAGHDGRPVIAEPKTVQVELLDEEGFGSDQRTLRVSAEVAVYRACPIQLANVGSIRVMTSIDLMKPNGHDDVVGALVKAAGLKTWTAHQKSE